jgi:hypothetical protein
MGYKRVLEENHNKAEKQTSKQMTCGVTMIILTVT